MASRRPTILDPNHRSLLIDAVRPPLGYRFDAGVATTYTLDLITLLTIPLHLAVLGSGRQEDLLRDPVALLEALRRTTARLAIVCQQGRIATPSMSHVLYGLLESCVVEVNAPHGGVFHPKLWMLRYVNNESNDVLIRLVVLSRNLTPDHSWDLSLVLEGQPKGRNRADNRALVNLLQAIPSMAAGTVPTGAAGVLEQMADEIGRTQWADLPCNFEQVQFHLLGLQPKLWRPEPSERLTVISPFITTGALTMLAESTEAPVALLARPEELARIPRKTLAAFKRCLVLHEQAEFDDADDSTTPATRGLHAKAFLTERTWHTKLYMGSANATSASLLAGQNVEVLVELTGRTSKVGGIDKLLGEQGMATYLTDFTPPPKPPQPTIEEQAEELLNAARTAIASMNLRIECAPAGDDAYFLVYRGDGAVDLKRIVSLRLWPIGWDAERATDAIYLTRTGTLQIGPVAAASLTGFTAFELRSDLCDLTVCFVLNIPVINLPALRDAAVLRTILANREGFLRYLLLLLSEDGRGTAMEDLVGALGVTGASWRGVVNELPLLEELTRALSRNPRRLESIKQIIEQLRGMPNSSEILPPEFMEVWQIYESLLEEDKS